MSKACVNEVDPVCGMVLKDCKVVETEEFGGKTYGFCSTKCKGLFCSTGTPRSTSKILLHAKACQGPKTSPRSTSTAFSINRNGRAARRNPSRSFCSVRFVVRNDCVGGRVLRIQPDVDGNGLCTTESCARSR